MPTSDARVHPSGTRVVVRHRLPEPDPATGARLTDVVGTLLQASEDAVTIETERGQITVQRELIVATRIIPPRPARRGAPHRALSVEDLERVMVGAWPPVERAPLGQWVLRSAGGFTNRANSALVVGQPDRPVEQALEHVVRWYAARGLQPALSLPLRPGGSVDSDDVGAAAAAAGWVVDEPVLVMTGATRAVHAASAASAGVTLDVDVSDTLTDDWFAAYTQYRSASRALAEPVLHGSPVQAFATVRDAGSVVGVGRLGVSDGWAGLGAMWVEPDRRGRGIGRAMVGALADVALRHGCVSTHLQVTGANARAIRLYEHLGFTPHHTYAYLRR